MLRSITLLTKDEKIRKRLQDCQDHDINHIVFGARGDHVSVIQTALFTIMPNLRLPDNELSDPVTKGGFYGPATAAAVATYKKTRKPPILNYLGQIDNIVGRQTITALDKDLGNATPPSPPPTPMPPVQPTPVAKFIDIVVEVQGYDNVNQQGQRTFSGEADQSLRDELNYNDEKRRLFKLSFNGGEGAKDPTKNIVSTIETYIGYGQTGLIFLHGGSAGGHVILSVGNELTEKNVKIRYVGVWDGAFQLSDRVDPSFDVRTGASFYIKTPNIKAETKRNWYQTLGNELVPEQEIHGMLVGFENWQIVNPIEHLRLIALLRTQHAAESAHIYAYQHARSITTADIRRILMNEAARN